MRLPRRKPGKLGWAMMVGAGRFELPTSWSQTRRPAAGPRPDCKRKETGRGVGLWYPRRGSNSRLRLRRPALYPLSYRGTLPLENITDARSPTTTPVRAIRLNRISLAHARHSGESRNPESPATSIVLSSLAAMDSGLRRNDGLFAHWLTQPVRCDCPATSVFSTESFDY